MLQALRPCAGFYLPQQGDSVVYLHHPHQDCLEASNDKQPMPAMTLISTPVGPLCRPASPGL